MQKIVNYETNLYIRMIWQGADLAYRTSFPYKARKDRKGQLFDHMWDVFKHVS